jgi:hypothetical protein
MGIGKPFAVYVFWSSIQCSTHIDVNLHVFVIILKWNYQVVSLLRILLCFQVKSSDLDTLRCSENS